jgi:hypothetical protein
VQRETFTAEELMAALCREKVEDLAIVRADRRGQGERMTGADPRSAP